MANAVWTWGVARATDGRVLLRIEDHDRQRCRPAYDAALLEDLAWLGFTPDLGPVRQTDPDALAAYAAAVDRLRTDGLVYGCDCTRTTVRVLGRGARTAVVGSGLSRVVPRRARRDGPVLRVALGGGSETWMDGSSVPALTTSRRRATCPIRDRHGNWTYGFCVVVDDLRQGIDLVVRGRDLLHATPAQIRLGRLLGRTTPPTFLHHRLIRRPDGSKLSKSDGDTGVRELRAAGLTAADVIARASGEG